MGTLILFKSKTGATQKYAQWLDEELENSQKMRLEELTPEAIHEQESLIFCLPTYGGMIDGKDILTEYWQQLKTKKIYLLVVGMVPEESEWSKKSYRQIPQHIRDEIKGYAKLPGVSTKQKDENYSWLEKLMLKLFLKVKPSEIHQQSEVKREDLDRFLKLLD